jgi:hypothetical protein
MVKKKDDARAKWMEKFHPEMKEDKDDKGKKPAKKGKGGKCK